MSTNREIYGRGLTGLLKRGWHEIPGVMGATVMGVLGLVIGFTAISTYFFNPEPDPKYKRDYIVYRSDDPRAKRPVKEVHW